MFRSVSQEVGDRGNATRDRGLGQVAEPEDKLRWPACAARAVLAHSVEAEGDRRQKIWDAGLRVYPGWSQSERRASHRRIAVFVLEPV